MTNPTGFLVDGYGQPLKNGFYVDPTGAIFSVTLDSNGTQITSPVGGGGGGGVGTVKSINTITPDGTGNVYVVANDVNGVANMIGWNLDTNVATPASPGATFTPASGTFPTGGYTLLQASGGTPRTLDGSVYAAGDFAEFSPALGVWVHIGGNGSGVTRTSNYTAGTVITGVTTESAQQMLLQLAASNATLVTGQRFEIDFYSALSSDSGTTTIKHYVNGTLALSGVAWATATFNAINLDRIVFIVIDATHVYMRVEFNVSATSLLMSAAILTVTTGTGLSIAWTYTNSTTGHTAQAILADARAFQP